MSDWTIQQQNSNQVNIWTGSLESLGGELAAFNTPPASAVYTANLATYIPFTVGQPYIAAKMYHMNGATATGNVDIGIYDEGGARLISTGSTAQAGTNTQQVFDITDTLLLPGRYYMAFNASSGSSTGTSFAINAIALRVTGVLQQAVGAVTLPSSATFAGVTVGALPMMGITARTVI